MTSNPEGKRLAHHDPVDHSEINEQTTTFDVEYDGGTYRFVSEENKKRFLADPERYVSRADSSQS